MAQSSTVPPPPEQLDPARVRAYLAANLPEAVATGKLEIERFPSGRSNLTYGLKAGAWEGVLRRPPHGPVAPRAHDMGREFRLLARLHPVFPLAPRPLAYCDDPAVLGAEFYVMERRQGWLLDRAFPPDWPASPALHRQVSEALVRTLVDLHAVDWRAASLDDLGRPAGYVRRQVEGWAQRFDRARTDDAPDTAALTAWLLDHLPPDDPAAATVIHNDYKLNNVLLDHANPSQIVAVLDWELATVGDPLSDLGMLLGYWCQADDDLGPENPLPALTTAPGFLTRREVVDRYARLSGREPRDLDFYLALASFKIAGIYQQIYVRWRAGQTQDPRFATLGRAAATLVQRASEYAAGRPL